MKKYILSILVLISPLTMAEVNDENEVSYDGILAELSSNSSSALGEDPDPFAHVLIHGGFAFATTWVSAEPQDHDHVNGLLKGVEASFGIDLFSRHWLAEGAIRSFDQERLDNTARVSLKEFDLKGIYRENLSRYLILRLGLGLSARYMNYTPLDGSPTLKQTTPSSVAMLGFQAPLTKVLSLGIDVSMRTPLIEETFDKTAMDAVLRADAHF